MDDERYKLTYDYKGKQMLISLPNIERLPNLHGQVVMREKSDNVASGELSRGSRRAGM